MSAFIFHMFGCTGKVGGLWCTLMHDSPMWPIHGRYECRRCGRHHRVPWEAELKSATAAQLHQTQVSIA